MNRQDFASLCNGPTNQRIRQQGKLYEISPRHLALGGDPRHVTEYLLAAGWTDLSAPGFPHILLHSPDRSLQVIMEPGAPDPREAWWRITHVDDRAAQAPGRGDDDTWLASFGGNCPAEIIAGFTDALLHPEPRSASDVWNILADRGWELHEDHHATSYPAAHTTYAVSSQKSALLARHPVGALSGSTGWEWKTEVTFQQAGGRWEWVWGARIPGGAPAHAVAGFVAALSDPALLVRHHGLTLAIEHQAQAVPSSVDTHQQQALHHARLVSAAHLPGTRSAPPTPLPRSGGMPPGPRRR